MKVAEAIHYLRYMHFKKFVEPSGASIRTYPSLLCFVRMGSKHPREQASTASDMLEHSGERLTSS